MPPGGCRENWASEEWFIRNTFQTRVCISQNILYGINFTFWFHALGKVCVIFMFMNVEYFCVINKWMVSIFSIECAVSIHMDKNQ